jgi:uncharacterized protein
MIREGVKLPKGVECKIPELIQAVVGDNDVIALYAFGSIAQNALKPLSDLDFGFLLSHRVDKIQRLDKHLELIGLFTSLLMLISSKN